MKVLVTGAAGFIGFHVTRLLLKKDFEVVALDNLNDYYDVELKIRRLGLLGLNEQNVLKYGAISRTTRDSKLKFIRLNVEDRENLPKLFENEAFDKVCHLAAQAGVRYSIKNPEAYVDSNLIGFWNILECCRKFEVEHLVYASSSSVYGLNQKIPFSTEDRTDSPISLYAATKKSNELMAHTYSHLFSLKTTGLRFFTVYGPWGRPDMALYLFTEAISKGQPIQVFNNGEMERDFTYVTDVAEGVVKILAKSNLGLDEKREKYKVYNLGNNQSVPLMDFIEEIEKNLGIKAIKKMMPMQPGDVKKTWANVDDLIGDYDYAPNTSIKQGVKEFVDWYLDYKKV